jgi:hypothetical protein
MLLISQFAACMILAVLAMGWRLKHSKAESAHRFLFPAIVTAGLLGCGLLLPFAMETFIAYYSGSSKPMAVMRYRLTGPYWFVYFTGILLPPLPLLGLIPAFGKKPILMAVIAVLAALPVALVRWQGFGI